jgi:hypothetical protein
MPVQQFGRSTAQGVIPRGASWEVFGEGGYVRTTGFEAVRKMLDNRIAACRAAQGLRVVIGSAVPYAPFVNWGTKFMQGRFFLQAGNAAARTYIARHFKAALDGPPSGVLQVFVGAGDAAIKAMFPLIPARTGRLRREQRASIFGSRG